MYGTKQVQVEVRASLIWSRNSSTVAKLLAPLLVHGTVQVPVNSQPAVLVVYVRGMLLFLCMCKLFVEVLPTLPFHRPGSHFFTFSSPPNALVPWYSGMQRIVVYLKS